MSDILLPAAHVTTITSALEEVRRSVATAMAHNADPYLVAEWGRLDAALQAIEQAQAAPRVVDGAWMPVEDGEYTMPLWDGDTYTLHVTDNGETLEAWPDADKHKFKDGSPKQVEEIGLNDYRLCMRTAASSPATATSEPVSDWSTAPEWAMWWAVDDNGCCYWYENKPVLGVRVWMSERGKDNLCIQYPGWRATLRQRPSAQGDETP